MNTEFRIIKNQNTNLSSLICFMKVLHTKQYSRSIIRKGFNKLVSKEDYSIEDRDEILEYCLQISP